MKRNIFIVLALLASCSDTLSEQEPGSKVKLSVTLPQTKVGLSQDRTSFEWQVGDKISVLNDANTSVVTFGVPDGDIDVPLSAKTLYGVYPEVSSKKGPISVDISIPPSQSQTAGGVFPSENYPMK